MIDLFSFGDSGGLSSLFAALSDVELVGHNLQFDLQFLARIGFEPGRVYDTMVASHGISNADAVERGRQFIGHGLKDVAHRELAIKLVKELQSSDSGGAISDEQINYPASRPRSLVTFARWKSRHRSPARSPRR